MLPRSVLAAGVWWSVVESVRIVPFTVPSSAAESGQWTCMHSHSTSPTEDVRT